MLNNIEQAIANVLSAKLTPDYYNVMDEYIRLREDPFSGDPVAMIETTYFFERVMDKYPDVGEKVGLQAPFANLIAGFRKTQWELSIEMTRKFMGECFPCPCCGIPGSVDDICQKLGLLDDMEIDAPPTKSKKPKSRRRVSNKTKSKKSNRKMLAFDPYGPSTSAWSM